MDLSNYPILQQAASLMREGNRKQATKLLAAFLKSHPQNEQAWHLLSYALDDTNQKIYALKKILQINPENAHVNARLQQLVPEPAKPQKLKVPERDSVPVSPSFRDTPPPRRSSAQ